MSFPPPTERQARVIWLALTGLSVAALVALVVALVWGLGHVLRMLSPVLWPIAVAGVIAYLLDPVVDFIERRDASRPRAILCVFGLALVIVAFLFGSVVPQLINETRQLAVRIPAYMARVEQRASYWLGHPPALVKRLMERESGAKEGLGPVTATNETAPAFPTNSAITATVQSTNAPSLLGGTLDNESLQTATKWLAGALPKVGYWLFGQFGRVASWFGFLAGMVLVPVYTFYFLLEKRGISSRWTDYLPVADSGFKNELVFVLNSINNYLITFFRGQILGAIVTCSTALIIALVQFGDWQHPLLVLAVFGFVQALEGLFISPKIMGGRVGLHPVTIIIAVMAGTTLLGGLLGGILAIPLTAALRVLMFRYVWKRRAGGVTRDS